ncbi:MAG: glycosyltransferase family 2 protein [Chthoniobacterales bacterium]
MFRTSAPRVSIIIASYATTRRQAELLDETLSTVGTQTCQDFECIVVDDGSPVDVRQIATRHPRTITIRQENAGPAVARNTGIHAARGDHFVFLDADDHLLPVALEAGLATLDSHPECGFVVGGREEMTYDGGAVPWSVPASPQETDLYHILLGFDWYIIPPSSVMFRRDVVETIGPWRDPWGADDLDYYLRAARAYRGRCFDDLAVTRYRRYAESSSRDGARMLRSARAVYARQWPLVQSDPAAEAAYHRGLGKLTEIFRDCLAENLRDHLRNGNTRRALACAALLARESPQRLRAEARRALRFTSSSSAGSQELDPSTSA